MTMHLVGPYLTTTGKRKGKTKFKSAAQAKQARELDKQWQELQQRWGVSTSTKKTSNRNNDGKLEYRLSVPEGRATTSSIKSVDTGHIGAVSSPERQQYTGTNVVGIVVQHKSCLQPVFNLEAAADSAKMRR
jgi:hypothetical protein